MPAHPNDRVIACTSQHGDKWMTLSNANSVIITWFTRLSCATRRMVGPPSRREATTTHFAPAPHKLQRARLSLCDKNVKIDGAAALGQQLDGRQRGRALAWSFVAREPGRRRLPPPPRRLSQTKETTLRGQNSFSVICGLIGRRRRKRVCGACRMIGSMSAGAENCSPSQASLPLHPSPPCDRQLG